MNPVISTDYCDLNFSITGKSLPIDHSYSLYAAISKRLDNHLPDGVGITPVFSPVRAGSYLVLDHSFLRIRTPNEHIGTLLKLSGTQLEVENNRCIVGVPNVYPIVSAQNLFSPFVTFKNALTEEQFLQTATKMLESKGITAKPTIPLNSKGFIQRKVRSIKGSKIVGFACSIDNLTPDQSLMLLCEGLGGRRHMGAGIFMHKKG